MGIPIGDATLNLLSEFRESYLKHFKKTLVIAGRTHPAT